MTAEIAVMNKHAVALAADSKVTVSGPGTSKTYDTVNKVFTLSKIHPMGIMIYGNAEFMQYPWETVIKLYRKEKNSDSFPTVEAWCDDFLKYVSKFGKIGDAHKLDNVGRILASTFSDLKQRIRLKARQDGVQIGSDDYEKLRISELERKAVIIAASGRSFAKATAKKVIDAYADEVIAQAQRHFPADSGSPLFEACLRVGFAALLSKELSSQSSGIAIAGFGDDEFFPALASFETDGHVWNKVKVKRDKLSEITRANSSCIRSFAQSDMVQRFMNGVDTDLMGVIASGYENLVQNSCLAVLETYGLKRANRDSVRDEILKAASDSADKLQEDLISYARANFSAPVVRMVALLPKDELAHLAESLVALTSLKRRVSSDAETVGGPVDVALISKGDGFVWVKRKLYFSGDLNPEFMRNYMYEVT